MMQTADWVQVTVNSISIIVAVALSVWISPKIRARSEQKINQLYILRALLNTRTNPENPDYQTAIALIAIDFKDNKDVIQAKDLYLSHVSKSPPDDPQKLQLHFDTTNDLQSQFISKIANSLDVEISSDVLKRAGYISQAFVEGQQLQKSALGAMVRIADVLEGSQKDADGK
jgi:Family of unknown function (DUF6680)